MSTKYKENHYDNIICTSHGRFIERVGIADHKPVGIEIVQSEEGGWDVVACLFDDDPYVNDWISIGNAEETNKFATPEEARSRGIQIIEEELGPVKR